MSRAIDEVRNRENFAVVDERGASDIVIHAATPGVEGDTIRRMLRLVAL